MRGRLRCRTLFSQGLDPDGGHDLRRDRTSGPATGSGCIGTTPPEVYYVFAGAGIVSLDGREIAVKAGSAVFIPGMAEHGIRQTGNEILRLFYAFPVNSFDGVEYSVQRGGARVRRRRAVGRPRRLASADRVAIAPLPDLRRSRDAARALMSMSLRPLRGRARPRMRHLHLCCKVYTFPEIGKPPGVWCKHCTPGKGCAIHDDLPDQCRRVLLPVDDRRDHAGRVAAGPGAVRAVRLSDERLRLRSGRSRLARRVAAGRPTIDGLRAMAKTLLEQRRHLLMFVGDQATLVMPDEDVPLGQDDGRRQFPHRAGLRPERADLAGDEGLSLRPQRSGPAAAPGPNGARALI